MSGLKTDPYIIYLNCYLVDKDVRPAYLLSDYDVDEGKRTIATYFPDLVIFMEIGSINSVLVMKKSTSDALTEEDIEILSNIDNPQHDIKLGAMLGYTCPGDYMVSPRGRVGFNFFISPTNTRNTNMYLFGYVCNGMKYIEEAIDILNKIKIAFSEDPNIVKERFDVGMEIRYLVDLFPKRHTLPIEEQNEEQNEQQNEPSESSGGRKTRVREKKRKQTRKYRKKSRKNRRR